MNCARCGVEKPEGQAGYCKPCKVAYDREYYRRPGKAKRKEEMNRRWERRNPERHSASLKRRNVRKKYGLSVEEYDALLAEGCAICGTHDALGIDHCHTSGVVRQALCRACNTILGLAQDDPERLRAALAYLERHPIDPVHTSRSGA